MRSFAPLLLAAIVAATGCQAALAGEDTARLVPPATVDVVSGSDASSTALFAGGCFWGVQGVFQHVQGVTAAVSGYAGGEKNGANYDSVSLGITKHAESVQVIFDPRVISYGQLLQIFFSVAHDPTELNRQGPDTGTQYRSTIFPIGDEQTRVAAAYIAQLNTAGVFRKKLATTIEPNKPFFAAEGYHQDYLTSHPNAPYIVINDLPKIEALKRMFPERYRPTPVLVNGRTS